MNHRNAFNCSFGTCETARLGKKHIAGIHKKRNVIGESQHCQCLAVSKFLGEALAHLLVVAAYANHSVIVIHEFKQRLYLMLKIAEAHGA